MNPVVANQAQPALITPEKCHAYTTSLPNPRNLKPTFSFDNICRFMWARYFEFVNGGNAKKIAEELKKLYEANNKSLTAEDIHFFSKRVIKHCDFVSKEDANEAIHRTPLKHIQQQFSKIALSKQDQVPPPPPPPPLILPEIRRDSLTYERQMDYVKAIIPSPQQRRNNGQGIREFALTPDSLVAKEFLDVLDIQPEQYIPGTSRLKLIRDRAPNRDHVRLLGKRLDNSSEVDVLTLCKKFGLMPNLFLLEVVKEEHVDALIREIRESYLVLSNTAKNVRHNGMTVTQERYRFVAYLDHHKTRLSVSSDLEDRRLGERYQKIIRALDPKAA